MSEPQPRPPFLSPDPAAPPREPMFNLPAVIIALAALLLAVHGVQTLLDDESALWLFAEAAVVPARFSIAFETIGPGDIAASILGDGPYDAQKARQIGLASHLLDERGPRWWSLLTHGFLHAGWLHAGMNVLWLTVFGAPVARRLGAARFLVLVGAGVVAGAIVHIVLHPTAISPLVGASAGVSAAIGAAARFVFSQGLRFGGMETDAAVRRLPMLSLAGLVANRQALTFVILWFLTNWLFGAGVITFGAEEQSIAWQAHVGGFLLGLLAMPWLDRNRLDRSRPDRARRA
jgi:membrane associated rhomboid family serine protease